MWRRQLLIITTILIFTSCRHRDVHQNSFSDASVNELVNGIAKENVFMGGAVGIAGIRPPQWDRFEALEHKTDENDLLPLTTHPNAVVRCYAFEGLIDKNSPNVFSVLLKHLDDTAEVKTLFGCIGGGQKVGDFLLELQSRDHKLDMRQERLVDSILFKNDKAELVARDSLLERIQPEEQYYLRIRQIAVEHHNYSAAFALSKFQRGEDKQIIFQLLRDARPKARGYGLRCVINFPDPDFFPELKRMIEDEQGSSHYLSYLYAALVQYKDIHSRRLLEYSLKHSKGGWDSLERIDLAYQALREYPSQVYVGVVKYNFYK